MASASKKQEQAKDDAHQLREQASKLLENMTPQEREQALKAAREMAKQQQDRAGRGGGQGDQPKDASAPRQRQGPLDLPPEMARTPGEQRSDKPRGTALSDSRSTSSPVIDARGQQGAGSSTRAGPERTVSQWLGSGNKPGTGPADPDAGQAVIEQATRGAQQAVEDRTVPRSLDSLIERWYRRLPDAVGVKPSAAKPNPAEPNSSPKPAQQPKP